MQIVLATINQRLELRIQALAPGQHDQPLSRPGERHV
ncbi:MAG: hypothetical protein ACI9NC_006244, partial [Verrucomicrobiales bacterium]